MPDFDAGHEEPRRAAPAVPHRGACEAGARHREEEASASCDFEEGRCRYSQRRSAPATPGALQIFKHVFRSRPAAARLLRPSGGVRGPHLTASGGRDGGISRRAAGPVPRPSLHSRPARACQPVGGQQRAVEGWLLAASRPHARLSCSAGQRAKVLKGNPARSRRETLPGPRLCPPHKDTPFAWSFLCLMQYRAAEHAGNRTDVRRAARKSLSETLPLFGEVPGLAYAAGYERARNLW